MSGLFGPGGKPIKLETVDVKATIVNYSAEVILVQTFVSEETKTVGVNYKFPLDSDSAVCEFSANIDGREIKGDVQETQKAQEMFTKARSEGRATALAESGSPHSTEVFQLSIGALESKKKATVTLKYV